MEIVRMIARKGDTLSVEGRPSTAGYNLYE